MIEDIPRIGPYVVTSINIDRPVTSVGTSQIAAYITVPEITITLEGQYLECIICGEAGVFLCGSCGKILERTRNKIRKLKQI